MKQFIAIAFAFILAAVSASSSKCMYCRRMDGNAGFLVSYSFCNTTDTCLKDAWNYLNKGCESGWSTGQSYELEYCQPDTISCPGYESTPEKFGQYSNSTWSLASGGKCKIKIDATAGVARVIFDNTSFLGIEESGYEIGEVITIEEGITEILIYNGAETGPLTFDISFSGASALIAGAAATLTALMAF